MKRRSFLGIGAALAATPLLARPAAACEGKHGAEAAATLPAAPACGARVVARVGTNHGHVLQVSAADVAAGVSKTYDLTGSAPHAHAVTLGESHFAALRKGEPVRLTSSRDGHLHRLLVQCAPAVDSPESVNVCQVQVGGKDDHDLVITAADIAAKAEKTYEMQGIAVHSHSVRVSAADFEKLVRGEPLTITSGPGDGHSHVVFVRYPLKTKTG